MELYTYRAHFGASKAAPRWQQAPLMLNPSTIVAQQFFVPLDLYSLAPPYHHTPWGLLCWQSDRTTIMAASGYCGRSTWHTSMVITTTMARSCHSPRAVGRGPGQPTPVTVFRPRKQDQGSSTAWVLPYALYGQGDRRRCLRVCVAVSVCINPTHLAVGTLAPHAMCVHIQWAGCRNTVAQG